MYFVRLSQHCVSPTKFVVTLSGNYTINVFLYVMKTFSKYIVHIARNVSTQSENCYFLINNKCAFIRRFREISENSGNFDKFRNSGKCRKIFSGKIPGNFPPDFPAFSGDDAHFTALILSFKKLKIGEISGKFQEKIPGKFREIFSENAGKFSPNFSAFFCLNAMNQL